MKAEEIFNVIMKLTGEVEPVGDTAKDNHRMDNMRVFIEVFDKMHFVIDNVAYRYKDQIAQDATQQWLTGFLTEGLAKGIIAYGKQQYNNAIDDAAEKASTMIETRTDGYDTWDVYTVDKQSILTLKK